MSALAALRRHLDRTLFADPPPGESRLGGVEKGVLVLAFLALAMLGQLFRIGPVTALDSLWAEDGPVFLGGAISSGFWHDLTQTYAGYYVVVPRLIGEVGGLVPLRDAAAAIAIASTFVVAVSGLVVWFASAGLIRNPWLRGTLAVLAVLTPIASLESIAAGSYVIWYMAFATFWVLLWRPRTTWGAALAALFVLLTALSTPAVWFFAPLAALRSLAIRDRRDVLIVGAWGLGSLLQIPAYVGNDEPRVEPLWTHQIWTALLQRVLDGAAFGERLGGWGWERFGWGLLILLVVVAIVGLYLGLRRAPAAARWLAALAVPIAVLLFVVSVYQRAVGALMAWPADVHFGDGGRYAIIPALLLVSVALVLLDAALRRRPRPESEPGPQAGAPKAESATAGSARGFGPWLAAGAITVLLVGLVISFDVRDTAARGTPGWGDAIDTAAQQCEAQPEPAVPVPISPPPFSVYVPCGELIEAAD